MGYFGGCDVGVLLVSSHSCPTASSWERKECCATLSHDSHPSRHYPICTVLGKGQLVALVYPTTQAAKVQYMQIHSLQFKTFPRRTRYNPPRAPPPSPRLVNPLSHSTEVLGERGLTGTTANVFALTGVLMLRKKSSARGPSPRISFPSPSEGETFPRNTTPSERHCPRDG